MIQIIMYIIVTAWVVMLVIERWAMVNKIDNYEGDIECLETITDKLNESNKTLREDLKNARKRAAIWSKGKPMNDGAYIVSIRIKAPFTEDKFMTSIAILKEGEWFWDNEELKQSDIVEAWLSSVPEFTEG